MCASDDPEGPVSCTYTEANGEYAIVGLRAGSYQVRFQGDGDAAQYYDGAYLAKEATPVVVSAASTRSGIDAALSPGGSIRGKVTAAAGGKDASGVTVCASLVGGEPAVAGCGQTSNRGEYSIGGLDPGSYTVEFADKGKYETEFYDGVSSAAEATPVAVDLGAPSEGIDAEMVLTTATGPTNTVAPSISGSASVGSTLSCSDGTWIGEPLPTFSAGWLRDGTPIPAADGQSYVVTSADEGHQLSCEVTATNASGSASALSAAVSVPAGASQGKSGTPIEGEPPAHGQAPGPGLGSPGVSGYRVAAVPAPALAGRIGLRMDTLYVPLRCTATLGECLRVTVTAFVVEMVGRRVTAVTAGRGVRPRADTRTLVIGSASAALSAGGSEDVQLHLDVAGRRLLKQPGTLAALIELRSQSTVVSRRIVRFRERLR